jgi:hypothetical protein
MSRFLEPEIGSLTARRSATTMSQAFNSRYIIMSGSLGHDRRVSSRKSAFVAEMEDIREESASSCVLATLAFFSRCFTSPLGRYPPLDALRQRIDTYPIDMLCYVIQRCRRETLPFGFSLFGKSDQRSPITCSFLPNVIRVDGDLSS